ncbi:DNA polymerase III subunit delta' [Spiroplasma sp. TIUS-1]|uniref:DNA polymerase III subunit delta' n=1 Tax=Spiroplasma sp. TIUS-1 TaxID=216963 RepID=UPI0013980428|nr:DNA polymerase III subunit delta' [Spiroplasma sp. TIUS-1]QHX35565.1 DNA polymerase III subunit delta' [Spiroplasma sp. TIUS-1]
MNRFDLTKKIEDEISKHDLHHAILFESNNSKNIKAFVSDIARMIICPNNSNPSDNCYFCVGSIKNTIVNKIEIVDNVLIKKAQIENMIEKFSASLIVENKTKVYIIHAAELLAVDSSNALLKFLEEPSPNTYAILTTTNASKVMTTIKSRCVKYSIPFEAEIESEENELIDIIRRKDKKALFLFGNKNKKTDASTLINIIKETYKFEILVNHVEIAKDFLEAIEQFRVNSFTNMVLENLIVKIYEVI